MFIVTIDDSACPDMPPLSFATEHSRVVFQVYWLYRTRTASRQSHVIFAVVNQYGTPMDPRRGAGGGLLPFEDVKIDHLHINAPEAIKTAYAGHSAEFVEYKDHE